MEDLKPTNNDGGILRRIFDLPVASVYRGILPFVKKLSVSKDNGKVVDVGCGSKPYKNLFESHGWTYEGIDMENSEDQFGYHADDVIYFDGVTFPEKDASVEMVFHSEVIEHVLDTRHFLSECSRILKPNGILLFASPFNVRYHYIPYDYWRLTPTTLRLLCEEQGLEVVEIVPRCRDICLAGYKVLTIGYRLFFSKCWWRIIISVIFSPLWVLALLVGQISLHLGIGSEYDSLGYIVYCRKK